ncbi:hypothetical protein ABTY98_39570 [Streptomyces sp. NPDC096040]|uniref:hypothetical protein n=1 Tax=Streptomyces sp. NPDC096040 TaxID=3155541 RepID=UPI00331A491C
MTSTLPYAPDSPLAVLLDIAADTAGPDDDEQREDAATAAAHHVYYAYAGTLAQVVDAVDWRGYPSVAADGGRRLEPAAVAWLDGGAWLHHTLRITEREGATDVLTLIVPCTCGRGYVDITLDTEDVMVEILTDLAPTQGRSPHLTDTPVDCASVQAVPPLRQLNP